VRKAKRLRRIARHWGDFTNFVAGPVTQAIHLPTLATLGDRLQVVVHIMDDEVGTLVASRTGARSTTSVQTLLEARGS
jgi:hypothetical protein